MLRSKHLWVNDAAEKEVTTAGMNGAIIALIFLLKVLAVSIATQMLLATLLTRHIGLFMPVGQSRSEEMALGM